MRSEYLFFLLAFSMALVLGCVSPTSPPDIPAISSEVPADDPVVAPVGPVEPSPETTLIKSSIFVVDTGINQYYHVGGVVKNTGDVPLKHVRASITRYKSSGEKEVFEDIIVKPSRLAPGEYGAFDMGGFSVKSYQDKYEAATSTFSIDESEPYTYLKFYEDQAQDAGGYYKLDGYIVNEGSEQSPSYWVNAIFYDAEGNVVSIGTDVALKDGEGLKAGDRKFVSFVVAHPSKSHRITSYDVFVDYSK
ncbi:MAG: hypothetical protein ABII22_01845 [Candidatus Micrarchaeota archaeon]